MRLLSCLCVSVLLCSAQLKAQYLEYEGTSTFRSQGRVDIAWLQQFLPYNPIIVDAGSYTGAMTIQAAKGWPQSRLIAAIEPNPRVFALLQEAVNEMKMPNLRAYNFALNDYNGKAPFYLSRGLSGLDLESEIESSLLPPTEETEPYYRGPVIDVPCVVLDDWCRENKVDHIDVLRLDLEGAELQVLKSSPEILKKVTLLILPSFLHQLRVGMPNYFVVKDFLTKANFVPLAHWYIPEGRGLAVYISNEMFDAYFVRCQGLGIGGMQYP